MATMTIDILVVLRYHGFARFCTGLNIEILDYFKDFGKLA